MEEVKKERREEELSSPKKLWDESQSDPLDLAIAKEWFGYASQNSKTVRFTQKWPETVRLLRKDGFSPDQLRATLAFVKADDFWRVNAISLPGLRQRSKNGLMKIENILARLPSEKAPPKLNIHTLEQLGLKAEGNAIRSLRPGTLFARSTEPVEGAVDGAKPDALSKP